MSPIEHEKSIEKSERRYQRLFESAQDGMLILDGRTGAIVDANRFLVESIGYRRDELLGKMLWELGAFVDVEAWKRAFADLESKGYARYDNLELQRKDGSRLEVEFVCNAYDVDGVRVYQCQIRDIGDRRRAERALGESQLRYRSLFENVSDEVSIIDLDGTIRYVSASIREGSGFEPWDIVGRNFFDVVDPRDRDAARSAIAALVAHPGELLRFELRRLHKDGSARDVESVALNLRETQGIGGIVLSTRDVTARRHAELELAYNAAVMSAIQQQAPDGILLVDERGNVVTCNRPFLDIWGIPDDWPAGKPDAELLRLVASRVADAAAFTARVAALYADPDATGNEEIVLKDGRVLDRRTAPVALADGTYVGRVWFFRDVTGSRRAQEALAASAHRFHAMIENAVDIIAVADARGVLTYVSPSIRALGGYAPDEMLARSILDFVGPASADECRSSFLELLQNPGGVDRRERWYRSKDGSLRLMDSVAHNLLHDPAVAGVVVTLRDITDNVAAQAARERLAAMVEGSNDVIIGATLEGIITDWNRAAEQLYGYSRDEAIGRSVRTLVAPEQQSDAGRRIARLAAGESIQNDEGVGVRKDGARFDYSLSLSYLRDPLGTPIGMAAIMRDITERKQSEKTLQLFRALIERSNDAIVVADPETLRILDVNERTSTTLGYSREELLAMTLPDIDPDLNRAAVDEIQRQLRKTGSALIERMHRRKDGSTFPVEISIAWVQQDRVYQLSIIRDISERKTAEAEIAVQLDELRRWQQVTAGREERILSIKHEVNALLAQSGQPPRYPSAESDNLKKD